MTPRKAARIALAAALLATTALAPPAIQSLPYDLAGVLGASDGFVQPVEPGEQYPPAAEDRTIATVPEQAAPDRPLPRGAPKLSITLDASITGDSNITNSTDRDSVVVDYGTGPLPVPLDPNLREKAGLGIGLSGSASLKVPVAAGLNLALGAEGYVVEYHGKRGDDSSLLGAAGLDLAAGGGTGTLQLVAFDRWYGGTSAMRGFGLRGNWRQKVGEGRNLALYVDARRFDSGYGREFGGTQAAAYLAYDAVLNPNLTAAGGVYIRRDSLRNDSYSSTELGAYGNLTHYLSRDFTGGLSAGLSRAAFDEPVIFLSPEARRDWRYYSSLWVTTRKPLIAGLH
ncbi:MAG TPA: hypothetical protein VF606_00105, partial [Geminicoccaceae bacterium]